MIESTEKRAVHADTHGSDRGFTLIEVLIVIVVLGVIAAVTVFAVRGITDKGEVSSCQTDRLTVVRAAEYYLVEKNVDEIPASGVGADRFERTLVDEALLRDVSTFHDLQIDGSVSSTGVPCP